MKKVLLTVAMFIALSASVSAQSPNEFNYQAVARDASGNVIANQSVGVQISIIATDPTTGTTVYTETHTVNTNDFGLLNFTIGSGTVTAGDFTTIDWGNDAHFVEVSMDLTGGTTYTVMGTQQLVSVPYALHAETAGSVANDLVDDADADPANEIQDISLSGTDLTITSGSTVDLSVLQDGVNDADADPSNEIQDISLSGTDLTITSGSTVDLSVVQDGVNDADADPTNELQDWSTLPGIPAGLLDGIDDVDDADADPSNEIQDISLAGTDLSITSGSTIDLSVLQDGVDDADNDPTNELQDWSTLPGIPAGLLDGIDDVDDADADPSNEIQDISLSGTDLSITSGSTLDLSVLQDGVDDADNDPTNEIETWSTLAGIPAGFADNTDNVDDADNDPTNEIETWSTLAGIPAGFADNTDNVDDADNNPTNEIQSLSIAGSNLTISGGNTVTLPSGTGIWTTIGTDHHEINMGKDAEIRYSQFDLSGNDFGVGQGVFWGSDPFEDTGMFTDGDQLIFISPGDNQLVQFWEEDAHVIAAQIAQSGAYTQISDESKKENVQKIQGALMKIMNLSGYTYEFIQHPEEIKKGMPKELGVGVIAQELKEVEPRLVTQTHQGHYLVNYDGIVPILIEATKEQQDIIKDQQSQIDELKAEIEAIKAAMKK